MLTLYTWDTPNGAKPAILLEELGLDYTLERIDISKGDQHSDAFRAVNPNGKIPALIDGDLTLFESGAILMHLAEKHGRFLPTEGKARAETLSWTFWQVGGLGPMIGQWGHFSRLEQKHDYSIERYLAESIRLLEVMEGRLVQVPYLGGEEYTIADMMSYPWVVGGYRFMSKASPDRLSPLTAVRAWVDRVGAREAVQRAEARMKAKD